MKTLFVLFSIVLVVAASGAVNLPWSVTATALVFLTLLLAYLRFEKTVASTRVIAVLGVLTAVAVTLRQALHGVGASPIFSIIILVGAVFGWVEGFIVGSTIMLVSNFVVGGHGPWTPYQMLGAGLVGALAALIPKTKNKKLFIALLSAFAFLSAFLYGAVTDVFFWLAFTREQTLASYIGVHLAGTVNNTARAVGNVFFIVLLGPALYRVLTRFKNRFYVEYIK